MGRSPALHLTQNADAEREHATEPQQVTPCSSDAIMTAFGIQAHVIAESSQ